MNDNVIKLKIPEPEDFSYMMNGDNEIVGVSGKNVDMEFCPSFEDGFYFNGLYVKREELIALVLASGLWKDVSEAENGGK